MPAAINDDIHDASSTVIRPDDNGDWSEVNRKTIGLDQPFVMPLRNPINETVSERVRSLSEKCFLQIHFLNVQIV